MDHEKIAFIAQEISFTFEDTFHIKKHKDAFTAIFNTYLLAVDPGVTTDPYDAIVVLGKQDPAAFEMMVNEIKEKGLVKI